MSRHPHELFAFGVGVDLHLHRVHFLVVIIIICGTAIPDLDFTRVVVHLFSQAAEPVRQMATGVAVLKLVRRPYLLAY